MERNDFLSPSPSPSPSPGPSNGRSRPGGPRIRKLPPTPTRAPVAEASTSTNPYPSYAPLTPTPSFSEASTSANVSEILECDGDVDAPPVYSRSMNHPKDKAVQATPPLSHSRSTARFQVTPLPPPPQIEWESPAIGLKALPLEAARWTLSSHELQEIVTRSIRRSAQESQIRLISLASLDRVIPQEVDRLEKEMLNAQTRYRFLSGRRAMLLQSINSFACSQPDVDMTDGDGSSVSNSTLSSLTSQLASTISSLDLSFQSLLHATSQLHQFTTLDLTVYASALAVALRKLNGSYAKRTSQLQEARKRIAALEAEVEDAWRCAEELAKEGDMINVGEQALEQGVHVPDELEEGQGEDEELGDEEVLDPDLTVHSCQMAQVVGITGRGVVSKASFATLLSPIPDTPVPFPASESSPPDSPSPSAETEAPSRPRAVSQSASIASRTSTISQSRLARVASARKRSIRATKASLRLPKSVDDDDPSIDPSSDPAEPGPSRRDRSRSRSRSRSRTRGRGASKTESNEKEVPPVPRLPSLPVGASSFLHLDKRRRRKGDDKHRRGSEDDNAIDVADALRSPRGRRHDYESSSHIHPFSAPYDQSQVPAIYASRSPSGVESGDEDETGIESDIEKSSTDRVPPPKRRHTLEPGYKTLTQLSITSPPKASGKLDELPEQELEEEDENEGSGDVEPGPAKDASTEVEPAETRAVSPSRPSPPPLFAPFRPVSPTGMKRPGSALGTVTAPTEEKIQDGNDDENSSIPVLSQHKRSFSDYWKMRPKRRASEDSGIGGNTQDLSKSRSI
ncbi:hypothetical protein JAAARDRAFT_66909 [Jaapia argillacea MUCL 33604]|uniref:Uncharacterized protein n=1 Tax=Jaapia argillacea MUCL 33604 TaxID=933084 RepID=A0A067QEG1_9AGAM|nr:hypothetical protein JAAARDRAFT_66909 [Jaapia argillacea MUCL 33604]